MVGIVTGDVLEAGCPCVKFAISLSAEIIIRRPASQTECLATDALLRRYGIQWPSPGLCCGLAALFRWVAQLACAQCGVRSSLWK